MWNREFSNTWWRSRADADDGGTPELADTNDASSLQPRKLST